MMKPIQNVCFLLNLVIVSKVKDISVTFWLLLRCPLTNTLFSSPHYGYMETRSREQENKG